MKRGLDTLPRIYVAGCSEKQGWLESGGWGWLFRGNLGKASLVRVDQKVLEEVVRDLRGTM